MIVTEFDHGYNVLREAFHRALHDPGPFDLDPLRLTPLQEAFLETLAEFMRCANEEQWSMVRWARENGWPDIHVVYRYGRPTT